MKILSEVQKIKQYSPTSAYYFDKGNNDELDMERLKRKDIVYNLSPSLDIDMLSEELVHKTDLTDISLEKLLEVSEDNLERIENSIGDYVNFIKEKFAVVEDSLIEFPKNVFNARYNRLNIPDFINKETAFVRELEKHQDPTIKFKMVEKHCLDLIYTLRYSWYSISETESEKKTVKREIRKMILNIRNFYYAIDVKNINRIYLRLLSVDTVTMSNVTITDNNMQNASQTLSKIDNNLGNLKSLHDIKKILDDENFLLGFKQKVKNLWKTSYLNVPDDKLQRTKKIEGVIRTLKSSSIPVLYSTYNGVRPHKDIGDYEWWNGMQAFDLDIKMCGETYKCPYREKNLIKNWIYKLEDIERFKKIIHENLSKYSWYLCTKTSLSGKGLHILTKVKPFPHLYKGEKNNNVINYHWFRNNYLHKYAIIRWVLLHKCEIPQMYINDVIDESMNKIQQGIVLIPDKNALWNDKFLDLPLFYGYYIAPEKGLKFEDWILEKNMLKRWSKNIVKAQGHETLSSTRRKTTHTIEAKPTYDTINYEFSSVEIPNLPNVTPIDESKYDAGKRDFMRHKVLRTLIYIYGDSEAIEKLARHLLKVPDVFDESEFSGKWRYAKSNKFVFDDVINLLRGSGCNFDIDSDILEIVKDSKLQKAVEALKESDVSVNEIMPDYSFKLPDAKPYLGEIKDELIDSFESNKINVMESSAGTGKTSLFNALAREYRVCLVVPFTTILSNKVESDPIASKLFDVFYGVKKLKFENKKSVAMTYDKFERMTEDEYKLFDLIAIDESHLLFTSSYRSVITTGVAKNVNKFITHDMAKKEAMELDIGVTSISGSILQDTSLFKTMSNSGVKIVLMTGTITGELLYYRNSNTLNYIKVNSKHKYGKDLEIVLTDTKGNLPLVIANNIANDINEGKTVICPTNRGNEYVASIIAQVNYLTKGKIADDEWVYYKKENKDHPICLSITENSVLPNNLKIVFCSLYLSVGVDILSERQYSLVVDGDSNTAQDIEQYNNRIRRSKINCKVVYSALAMGISGLTEIKKSIYDTPNELELKRIENFSEEIYDDRRIAHANKEISKNDEYNVLKLPENLSLKEMYHTSTHKGIQFNEDKFLIDGFTKDYYKVAKGSAYTKHVLTNYYGYNVNYKVSVMDDEEKLAILKEIGKDASKKVVEEKMKAFKKTIDFMVENWEILKNRYTLGLKAIRRLDFELEIIEADKSIEGNEKKDYILLYPMNFEDMFKEAYFKMRMLVKVYSLETASKFLSSFMSDTGRLKKTELKRSMVLINLIRNSKDKDMPLATTEMYNIISEFLENKDGDNVVENINTYEYILDEMSVRTLSSQMQQYADTYYKIMSGEGVKLESIKRRTEMVEKSDETLKTVFKKRKTKEGDYKLKARIVPPFEVSDEREQTNFEAIMEMLRGNIKVEKKKKEEVFIEPSIAKRDPSMFCHKTSEFGFMN